MLEGLSDVIYMDDALIRKQIEMATIKNQTEIIRQEIQQKRNMLREKRQNLQELKAEFIDVDAELERKNLIAMTAKETLDEKNLQI
jgi:hypothetical protein